MKTRILETTKVVFLALLLTVGVAYVFATGSWTQAPANPPSNNTDAPINVGGTEQTKQGNLVIVGSLKLPSGSPALGDVLAAVDSNGTVGWQDPNNIGQSNSSIYQFTGNVTGCHGMLYCSLMNTPEFRTWFQTFTNGASAIKPLPASGVGYSNDEGFLGHGSNDTAGKLCQFFTNSNIVVSYKESGLGSDNNNKWTFWDTSDSSWKINTSTWNDSTDIQTLTCLGPNGVIRGQGFVVSKTGIYNTGGGTAVRTTY